MIAKIAGAFLGTLVFLTPGFCVTDSLYFLFQRSTYLENLCMPAAWWANPALVAEITEKTAMTVNVTPLGNVFTIASAKYCAPLGARGGWGVGLMGAGHRSRPLPASG